MAPKSLPPELLFEFVPFVRAEDAVPNAFSSCRLFHNLLLQRVDKWKEALLMNQSQAEKIAELESKNKRLEALIEKLNKDKQKAVTDQQPQSSSTAPAKSPSKPFKEKVKGRLTFENGSAANYPVSFGEVQRRVESPDRMKISDFLTLFHLRKTGSNSADLRKRIEKSEIKIRTEQRQHSEDTGFTFLLEAEAVQLSQDFAKLCDGNYPIKPIAIEMTSGENGDESGTKPYSMEELGTVRRFLAEILDFQEADESPHTPHLQLPIIAVKKKKIGNEVGAGFNRFSLATHGFGGYAFTSVINVLIELVKECEKRMSSTTEGENAGE
ncbi:hypothetical protein niasHS_010334 [Heterodera schachtii]|uniref:Transcription factor AP-2 C-terminal domain-containing protein n=1 Tax=Heterodera schachtii TaxID=97005 RepID=A0ABD2J4B3_HETSC